MISINADNPIYRTYNNSNNNNNSINRDTDPIYTFFGFLVAGSALLGGGLYSKSSYEGLDALRTVQNFPATISKITKYDVTYEGDEGNNALALLKTVRSNTDYNVLPGDVLSVNQMKTFTVKKAGSSATTKQTLRIVSVKKEAAEIEVTIVQNGVTSTAIISKNNFTREITDADVAKEILIEFDPNDLKNISMVVEGMTWGQASLSWGLISFGIIFIIVSLYILYTILAPKLFPKKN
jgi:hypothetical protein